MATELKLPDLGEGVSDVTISRWRVKEGAKVNSGDVILEVATDKVDTEVSATTDGVLLKINFKEGEMAPVDAVLGLIGEAGETVAASGRRNEAAVAKTADLKPDAQAASTDGQEPQPNVNGNRAEAEPETEVKASPVAQRVAADKGVNLGGVTGTGPGGRITKGDVLASTQQTDASPAQSHLPDELADSPSLEVSRLAAQYNIDLRKVAKGRPLSTLNRYDVMSVIEGKTVAPSFAAPANVAATSTPQPSVPAAKDGATEVLPAPSASAPTEQPKAEAIITTKAGEELVKHSRMRVAVAKNTSASAFTAPHVTTMWDVEMSAILAHRAAHKAEFAKAGVNLTVTPYLIEAILAGLKAVPAANATWTEEGVIIKRYYNVGMAVALPIDPYGMGGLIVPVIKNAGDLNLMGLARSVNDLSERARKNQLTANDLADGTFTLSNYGTSGSRFQTPIIVQPQVGILGVGAIEKRPIVVSVGHPLDPNTGDYLTFRPMTTLGFSYDHRVLDGATADTFCAAVKAFLEKYK